MEEGWREVGKLEGKGGGDEKHNRFSFHPKKVCPFSSLLHEPAVTSSIFPMRFLLQWPP